MLESSDWEFKTTLIHVLRALQIKQTCKQRDENPMRIKKKTKRNPRDKNPITEMKTAFDRRISR